MEAFWPTFLNSVSFCQWALQIPLQSFSQVDIWNSNILIISSFFLFISQSVVHLVMCLWSSCLNYSHALAIRQMSSHFTVFWNTEEFTVDLWWQGAQVLWLQNIPKLFLLTPNTNEWGVNILCLIFPKWGRMHCGQISSLRSNMSKEHYPKKQRCNPESCCHVLFREQRFSPATFSNKPHLFSVFLIVLSYTITPNMLTEVCRVWDV